MPLTKRCAWLLGLATTLALATTTPAAAVALDSPEANASVSDGWSFAWTLGEDDYQPVVLVFDQWPEAGVAPYRRFRAYDDDDDFEQLDGPSDLKAGRYWWTVSVGTPDGRTSAPAQPFEVIPTRLTRLRVTPSVGSGSVRLIVEANGFGGVQVSGEVRWRGRVIWSGDGYDPGGPAAVRRVEYPYDCRRPHAGHLRFRVAATDSVGTTLMRTGSFREVNCGNTPSPGESVYVPSRCTNQAIRPSSLVVACGDGNFQLRGLRWRSWGRASASARGRGMINDCIPACYLGRFRAYPASITVSRRERCANGRIQYTRLRYRIAARAPGPSNGSVPVPCDGFQ